MSVIGVLAEIDAQPEIMPVSEAQWVRILDGQPYRILVKEEQQQWAGKRSVRCINCKHATHSAGGRDPLDGLVHRAPLDGLEHLPEAVQGVRAELVSTAAKPQGERRWK